MLLVFSLLWTTTVAMKMLKVLVLIGLILLPSILAIEDGNSLNSTMSTYTFLNLFIRRLISNVIIDFTVICISCLLYGWLQVLRAALAVTSSTPWTPWWSV